MINFRCATGLCRNPVGTRGSICHDCAEKDTLRCRALEARDELDATRAHLSRLLAALGTDDPAEAVRVVEALTAARDKWERLATERGDEVLRLRGEVDNLQFRADFAESEVKRLRGPGWQFDPEAYVANVKLEGCDNRACRAWRSEAIAHRMWGPPGHRMDEERLAHSRTRQMLDRERVGRTNERRRLMDHLRAVRADLAAEQGLRMAMERAVLLARAVGVGKSLLFLLDSGAYDGPEDVEVEHLRDFLRDCEAAGVEVCRE